MHGSSEPTPLQAANFKYQEPSGFGSTLELEQVVVGDHHVAMRYRLGELLFSNTYWYETVDFSALSREFGEAAIRRIAFHIAAFEINKFVSLKPEKISFGDYADLVTPEFWSLWQTVWINVGGQWRYENDLRNYLTPKLAHGLASDELDPLALTPGETRTLAFVGGGKDSLIVMTLLDEIGLAYDTLGYSSSIYGGAAFQHRLLDGLVRHGGSARRHHRQWVFDDFLDSPVLGLSPESGIKTLTAGETPSSLFGVLPLVLSAGFQTLVLGHERSADHGNLVWDETGEEINHQWGKGIEAEKLLQHYVRTRLISGLTYTSVLKPIYDPVIFSALRDRPDAVRDTHSCNIRKPWCEECSKCSYVWLNYHAYLDPEVIDGMFRSNLADNSVNTVWFEQMFGLAEHTPFECVGQVDEALLALELATSRGMRGQAIDGLRSRAARVGLDDVERLFDVGLEHHTMPPELASGVVPILQRWSEAGLDRVKGLLSE